MATIRRRTGAYNVQIRKQGYSTITKTFSSITTARKWAAGVEADMERHLYHRSIRKHHPPLSA